MRRGDRMEVGEDRSRQKGRKQMKMQGRNTKGKKVSVLLDLSLDQGEKYIEG